MEVNFDPPPDSAVAHRPEPTTPTNLVGEKFDIHNNSASAPEAAII